MRNSGSSSRTETDLAIVKLAAMCMPDIVPDPAQFLRILTRPTSKFGYRIDHALVVLGEMRVQHYAIFPRQPAARRIGSPLTENGEQGATATRTIAPGEGS